MTSSWEPPSSPSLGSTTTYVPPKRTDPAAIVAFLLALSSFAIWFVPAIVALFLAPGAKHNVAASEGRARGKGLAIAAQVVSILTVASTAALLVALTYT